MELADVSNTWGAFYTPAFVVIVDEGALTQDLAIGVNQVEVDLSLSGMGRFSFTIVGAYDIESREFMSGTRRRILDLLTFQTSIRIALGYGDRARLVPMIAGVVTEISTSFSESGSPELAVAGYDNLFPLTLGSNSTAWKNVSDSDVVSLLATKHGLATDIDPTREKHAQIEQNQRSDFDLIKELAARNHYEFYMTNDNRLRFGRPNDRGDGIVSLRWGESLLNFKPVANLAAQVKGVEIHGWDPNAKKPIVGRAGAGEETGRDPRRQSGGQTLDPSFDSTAVLKLRMPVFTEAEAKERAKAVLNDHAKKFLTGEAESIGFPELRPDRNITIANLGAPFSKTYYVEQTTHKVDSGGYRTRFKVKETSLWR